MVGLAGGGGGGGGGENGRRRAWSLLLLLLHSLRFHLVFVTRFVFSVIVVPSHAPGP